MAADLQFWHTAGMMRCVEVWLCVLWVATGLSCAQLRAQDTVSATPTLHVYANLIQIPVLVLSPSLGRVKPIAASRFFVSVDGGPLFRVTDARPEADDPISLSIFVDTGEAQKDLLPRIDEAIATLGAGSLHARDEVWVYALTCSQMRIVRHVPPEQEDLKRAVDDALQLWMSRKGEKHRKKCEGAGQVANLRASLIYATRALARESGRRVMLAVTDGEDGDKPHTWDEVRDFAEVTGVAIFGMTYLPYRPGWGEGQNDAFRLMCERTGGRVLPVNQGDIREKMTQFVAEVRGRYIVEFPRPDDSTAGRHSLVVTIEKSRDFVRSAGVSVPVPDAARRADPMTVPNDPAKTPEMGTRKSLAPQR